jgi:hypothetical protein
MKTMFEKVKGQMLSVQRNISAAISQPRGRMRGQSAVDTITGGILAAVAIVTGIVSLIVVNNILSNNTLTGFTGLNATIAQFVVTLSIVGFMAAGAFMGLRIAGIVR